MARVDAFNKGRTESDDEFYTRYEDIQEKMNHYDTFFLIRLYFAIVII